MYVMRRMVIGPYTTAEVCRQVGLYLPKYVRPAVNVRRVGRSAVMLNDVMTRVFVVSVVRVKGVCRKT